MPDEEEDEPSQAAPRRPPSPPRRPVSLPQSPHEHDFLSVGIAEELRSRRRGEAARAPGPPSSGAVSRDARRGGTGPAHGLLLPGEKEEIVFPGDRVGDKVAFAERGGRGGGGGVLMVDTRNKAALRERIEGNALRRPLTPAACVRGIPLLVLQSLLGLTGGVVRAAARKCGDGGAARVAPRSPGMGR